MKAAGEKMQAGIASGEGVKAVDPAALQNLLPASIAGWNRTSIEKPRRGRRGGFNGSNARAQFQAGDQSFSLSVTDMGVMGNIATLGGAVNASSSKQTATGYEKTEMQGGNMVSEEWDNQSKSGKYSVMVASRFAVEASGSAPTIDALKGAVAAVDLGQLQWDGQLSSRRARGEAHATRETSHGLGRAPERRARTSDITGFSASDVSTRVRSGSRAKVAPDGTPIRDAGRHLSMPLALPHCRARCSRDSRCRRARRAAPGCRRDRRSCRARCPSPSPGRAAAISPIGIAHSNSAYIT